ncbi:hypothetical protein [Nocardia farcinica]|uniref:hypothetical protein n=1 Tax=Nocardia farcinica TaxID=37329 RepID=UPI002454D2C7|nr:hypothetical protein [Nocardia farcinica]
MTTPNDPHESMEQWQLRTLLTIGHLAAEHARILDAGWTGFDAVDDGGPEAAWQHHLEALDGERERLEQTALSAGVDPGLIADAAALGQQRSRPRVDAATRELSSPARDDAAAGFYVDMLVVDLWRLERMAAVAAARNERIATGRYSFGADPLAESRFAANMDLYHQRVTALATAARITVAEAEELWGSGAEPVRRQHAIGLHGGDELALIQEWNSYARPTTELASPPYIPPNPAAGAPSSDMPVHPPIPQQMIAAAEASIRSEIGDTALAGPDTGTTALSAISAAVDDALPVTPTTAPSSDTDPGNEPEVGYHVGYGNDP